MSYTVSQVASLASVSVRTLHHYDETGLLTPSKRSEAGYRLYNDSDLERLQQVLFFRELGFALDVIAGLMKEPGFDRESALLMQRELLSERASQLHAMIQAIDTALDAQQKGLTMSKEDMFEVFGEFDPAEHEAEVKERWGDSDAYAESTRRTKRYTKQDWLRIKEEGALVVEGLAARMDAGAGTDDTEVQRLVEEHRLQIDRNFYPCSKEMHANLGRMYVADPRFAKTYDDVRPGLAQFLCDAIQINAE
ncbi:MAG: MerR family transcriptional regulator [Actinomycetota bacterium]|jgi:DNA-binding transcriptional MerR regulator|nr:MerR family transcriptional regulator [Actinomycetota bacterium]